MLARLAALSNKAAKARAVPLPAFAFTAPSAAEGFVGFTVSLALTTTIADSSDIVMSMDAFPASASAAFTDNGDGTATLLWTPTVDDVGTASFSFSAGDAYGRSITRTWAATIAQPAVGEALAVLAVPVVMPTVDVSDGAVDFAHWGLVDKTTVNRKIGTPVIGSLTSLNGSLVRYIHDSDTRQAIAWTGGTPTESEAGTRSGIYVNGVGAGLRLTVPVTAVSQELTLYCARGNASANVVATISGGPTKQIALPFTADAVDAAVAVQFFGEVGQTLTVDIVKTSDTGSVAVRAAKLTGSIGLSWSEPLSGTVYEPLTSTLTLSDFTGTAVIAATHLPGSSNFVDNGDNTATFSITPTASDASASPLIFEVTVFNGTAVLLSTQYTVTVAAATAEPPVIALGSTLEFAVGTEKSVTVSATGETPIALTVSVLPGSATWLDNGDGTATLTWNPASGSADGSPYPVTITATDIDGRKSTLSESIAVSNAAVDILTVALVTQGVTTVEDLTAGSTDWVAWGRSVVADVDRKTVTPIIGDLVITGSPVKTFVANTGSVSWTDGTPTLSGTYPSFIRLAAINTDTFALTVPATPSTRTLLIYCGAEQAANIRATADAGALSQTFDFSLPASTPCVLGVELRSSASETATIVLRRNGSGRIFIRAAKLIEGVA